MCLEMDHEHCANWQRKNSFCTSNCHCSDGCISGCSSVLNGFENLGVYVVDEATRRILYFNKHFRELCPEVRAGMVCRDLDRAPCNDCPIDALGDRDSAHKILYSDSFGDTVELTATRIRWRDATPAIMICAWPRYISLPTPFLDGEKLHESTDYLTGALTRIGFIRYIELLQKRKSALEDYAILFVNIKSFKAVNEMVGSTAGDDLLRIVYARISDSALHPIIGSRKESDHFLFLVEKSKLDANVLPGLLSFRWVCKNRELTIHCRCGIFMIDDPKLEIYKMIDRAKLAKEHIVDEFVQPFAVYNQSMLEEYAEHTNASFLFDDGMRRHDFVVYYQPVMDAKTEKVIGAEALVRKITADGGIMAPGRFIPMLERTGYISMLDRFVASKVRALLYDRKDFHPPLVPISFNLSQKDFYDTEFIESLITSLENDTLPKGSVMLELTESTYTMHIKKHKDYLTRLREAGALVLIDDFGTGYSSFGMFENYNFDRIKLDMSFVRRMVINKDVRMVVDSLISMFHKLGIQVVAEGVETEEELKILRQMNCDFIQGYYFSKPLPKDQFVVYLESHS